MFSGRFRWLIKSKSNKNYKKKNEVHNPRPEIRSVGFGMLWFNLPSNSLRSSVWLAELLSEETSMGQAVFKLAPERQCLNLLLSQGDIISSFISPFCFPDILLSKFWYIKMRSDILLKPEQNACVGSYVIGILDELFFSPAAFCWFQTSEGKNCSGTTPHTYVWDMNCVHVTGRLSAASWACLTPGSR